MKKITMDFETYEFELNRERLRGRRTGAEKIIEAWKQKNAGDLDEALCLFEEEFEGCTMPMKQALKDVGLLEAAEKKWGGE